MREIVFIQVGQCGNKIGEKFWELLSDEHNINRCGHFYGTSIISYQRLNVYFDSAQSCKFVPRCVMCDLETTQIYSLRCSAIGKIFNPDHFITGAKGAGNNWAKGFYTEGAELMDSVLEVTRKQTEGCDSLQGFQMVHSIGGGSGSGFGSLLLNRLNDDYQDRLVNTFTVVPSSKVSETVVEPYNAVLSLPELICNSDETVIFDNEALYDVCLKKLKLENPKLGDLNHLISMTMAGITTCFRYPGQLNTDLRKLLTNMCPYPSLHFFLPGYAPLQSRANNKEYCHVTVKSIVKELFDPQHQMAAYDACSGKFITCAAIFRGLVSSREVEEAMVTVQENNADIFAKWIPNSIKTAICDIPPKGLTMSATLLANTTAITVTFDRLVQQFDKMFDKRAFVHWYTGEGMDEQEFSDAKEAVVDLCEEYKAVGAEDDEEYCQPEGFLESGNYEDICSYCSSCDEPMCECDCKISIENEKN